MLLKTQTIQSFFANKNKFNHRRNRVENYDQAMKYRHLEQKTNLSNLLCSTEILPSSDNVVIPYHRYTNLAHTPLLPSVHDLQASFLVPSQPEIENAEKWISLSFECPNLLPLTGMNRSLWSLELKTYKAFSKLQRHDLEIRTLSKISFVLQLETSFNELEVYK